VLIQNKLKGEPKEVSGYKVYSEFRDHEWGLLFVYATWCPHCHEFFP